MRVEDWIEQNYLDILQWSKQICMNHHGYIDLAHDIIIAFQEHEKAQELVDKNEVPFHTTLGSGWAKYAAVVYAADDKTDKKIREMEPPNHGTIECERIIDPAKREKIRLELDAAKEKIAEIIGDALRHSVKDQEINVSELASIMAIDDDGNTGKSESGASLTSDLQTRQITPSKPGTSTVPEADVPCRAAPRAASGAAPT